MSRHDKLVTGLSYAAVITGVVALLYFVNKAAGAAGGHRKPAEGCRVHRVNLDSIQARVASWRLSDALEVPRATAGYHPGRVVRSCRRAKQIRANWTRRAATRRKLLARLNSDIRAAIAFYFPPGEYDGAVQVARCETGDLLDDVPAALVAGVGEHQYTGIFQMGDWERATFATWRGVYRYSTVVEQVAAAARYQRSHGWYPWQCRPEGGLRW